MSRSSKFASYPSKTHFMTSKMPANVEEVFGKFTTEMREEIYAVAVMFYQLGFKDAVSETAINLLSALTPEFPKD